MRSSTTGAHHQPGALVLRDGLGRRTPSRIPRCPTRSSSTWRFPYISPLPLEGSPRAGRGATGRRGREAFSLAGCAACHRRLPGRRPVRAYRISCFMTSRIPPGTRWASRVSIPRVPHGAALGPARHGALPRRIGGDGRGRRAEGHFGEATARTAFEALDADGKAKIVEFLMRPVIRDNRDFSRGFLAKRYSMVSPHRR